MKQRKKDKQKNKTIDKYKSNLLLQTLRYIKNSKDYIFFIIIVFFIFILFGFFNAPYLTFIDEIIKNILSKTRFLDSSSLIQFIFLNNTKSAFLGIFLGIFFGIISVINAISNGIVLGYVLNKVWALSGFSDFWRILPHGIFELPAIFISLGLGVKLGALSPRVISTFITHYIKNNKIIFIIPFILSLIISLPLTLSSYKLISFSNSQILNPGISLIPYTIFFFIIFFFLLLILSIIAISIFMYNIDNKFKDIPEIKIIMKSYLYTLLTFILIIIPLLIIAALIEGILIASYE